jgi:hypothetical protein
VTWQNSLLQPILKKGKPIPEPASYSGIYLNVILAKLFEGILITRLNIFTELNNTLTENQLGTQSDRQTHDAIYTLLLIIQYNFITLKKPTFVRGNTESVL